MDQQDNLPVEEVGANVEVGNDQLALSLTLSIAPVGATVSLILLTLLRVASLTVLLFLSPWAWLWSLTMPSIRPS